MILHADNNVIKLKLETSLVSGKHTGTDSLLKDDRVEQSLRTANQATNDLLRSENKQQHY